MLITRSKNPLLKRACHKFLSGIYCNNHKTTVVQIRCLNQKNMQETAQKTKNNNKNPQLIYNPEPPQFYVCNYAKLRSYITWQSSLQTEKNPKVHAEFLYTFTQELNYITRMFVDYFGILLNSMLQDPEMFLTIQGKTILLKDFLTEEAKYMLLYNTRNYSLKKEHKALYLTMPFYPVYNVLVMGFPLMFEIQVLRYNAIQFLTTLLNTPTKVFKLETKTVLKWNSVEYKIISKHLHKEIGIYEKFLKDNFSDTSFFYEYEWLFICRVIFKEKTAPSYDKILYNIEKTICGAYYGARCEMIKRAVAVSDSNLLRLSFQIKTPNKPSK